MSSDNMSQEDGDSAEKKQRKSAAGRKLVRWNREWQSTQNRLLRLVHQY